MSVKDLIARWEDALVEAQLAASLGGEISDEELAAAAAPSMRAATGLRAGEYDPGPDTDTHSPRYQCCY